MNLKNLNEDQLQRFLGGVNKLADAMNANKASSFSGDDDARTRRTLEDAERSARAYAKNRNAGGGTMPSRDADLSKEEKTIADETRAWIARQRKRGWWGNK